MAVLTNGELQVMRREWERLVLEHGITKEQVNDALQAVEDRFESARTTLNNDINTATAPVVLTLAQKKLIIGVWCALKAYREGVI